MTTQLTVRDLSKSFNDNTVLADVTCAFPVGAHSAIVGENGSGKSTLLRLLAGEETPDAGQVTVLAAGGVGYLAQDARLAGYLTVQKVIDAALSDLRAIATRLRHLESAMAAGDTGVFDEYSDLQTVYELRGGYDADARVERALSGLGLRALPRERTVGELSGGEQARLRLATLLAAAPEVLLLDEPTNHLDDDALVWLEDHLRARRGTTVTVTHDRTFLDRAVTTLFEVDGDRRVVTRYGGGYTTYLAEKEAARRRWAQDHAEWETKVAAAREATATTARRVAPGRAMKDRNKMAYGMRGDWVEKSLSARIRAAEERLRRLLDRPVPQPPEPLRFTPTFTDASAAHAVITADAVSVEGRLTETSLAVEPGQRLLVTGGNGAGKSTLMRLLAGDLQPHTGTVTRRGRIGYLPQDPDVGAPGDTLSEAFARGRPGPPDAHHAQLLSFGLFDRERLRIPVEKLSVGQRQRLMLACVLSEPVDVLLLDEPTNHLSPTLVEELEAALLAFTGALVVVSHDRRLRERWTGTELRVEPAPSEA
ncbi:ribosomal protection-like ABC-F family protein [Spiractinospora alimapuensis]|uniref:ribosomal protection-like ABC-F family protein n=1 Tax=Spiractinospora alimapuensis TaxID=2820884 RepID=UPI002ED43B6E